MNAYISEFIGTLVFLSSIKATSGNPVIIGVVLALMVFLTSGISGGNLNPAVSLMSYVAGSLSAMDTMLYVVVQLLAGILVAMYVPKMVYTF
jgi:glycerol uptake facilitator-like aquaporin